MRLLSLLLGALLALAACANDSAVTGVGGTVHRLRGEHASIRMVREHVAITVYPAYYQVDARFVFHNDGKACTVRMGFPESGGGADLDVQTLRMHTAFKHFTTWVDGAITPVTREKAEVNEYIYRAFWVKQVKFAAKQTRTVRVQYQSIAGNESMGSRYVKYDFTGGNWKGTVDESVLDLIFALPETCFVNAPASAQNNTRKNHFHYSWKRWQAEKEFTVEYLSTWPEWLTLAGETTDPFPLSGKVITLTQPGYLAALDWIPPAVVRDNTAFISLEKLWQYLEEHAVNSHREKGITQSWNPSIGMGELRTPAVTLSFRLKSAEMVVVKDGARTTVRMPAAAFLSRGHAVGGSGQLFVPAAVVIKALGGTVAVDAKTHRMTITLPRTPSTP